MKAYLKRLNFGSTLFAFAAVAIAIAVIRTDLEHRPYPQLPEPSPALQTAKAPPLNTLGDLVGQAVADWR
ncbi:MAG: hypothetical protein ACRED0_00455 [Gammaproteobacteria bacterium]